MQRLVLLILAGSLLVSCRTAHPPIDTTNLASLENVNAEDFTTYPSPEPVPTPEPGGSSIRLKALADTALSIGAQAGLAYASKQINLHENEDRWNLDAIYNFNAMMLTHGVLPPVLAQGNNSLNLSDPNTIRIADKTYKIIAQARFATTPPNWRDYLIMDFQPPALPHRVLLPQTADEGVIWRKNVRLGWEKGLQQAYSIHQQNLNRLKRDFSGMILYRKLLQERMVSPPFVARTELGVTGSGTDMRINDQVLRIVELPKLQTDSNHWKAIVVTHHD